jgi:23S rRNA (cytidine1920-2'-O)/16S rRNA (cytidine1409-2'-O)-methyltransferase
VNARHLGPSELPEKVSVLVLDVSFISLTQVLPATVQFLLPGGVTVALVKPQFEAGREQVGKGGVVRDDTVRAEAVARVRECVEQLGLLPVGALDSPVHGPAGNREILLVARRP